MLNLFVDCVEFSTFSKLTHILIIITKLCNSSTIFHFPFQKSLWCGTINVSEYQHIFVFLLLVFSTLYFVQFEFKKMHGIPFRKFSSNLVFEAKNRRKWFSKFNEFSPHFVEMIICYSFMFFFSTKLMKKENSLSNFWMSMLLFFGCCFFAFQRWFSNVNAFYVQNYYYYC